MLLCLGLNSLHSIHLTDITRWNNLLCLADRAKKLPYIYCYVLCLTLRTIQGMNYRDITRRHNMLCLDIT